jgi:hypothetical protein
MWSHVAYLMQATLFAGMDDAHDVRGVRLELRRVLGVWQEVGTLGSRDATMTTANHIAVYSTLMSHNGPEFTSTLAACSEVKECAPQAKTGNVGSYPVALFGYPLLSVGWT